MYSELIMAAPTKDTGNTPISLAQRAPVGPIPTRTWHMYLRYGLGLIEYKSHLEQKNHCIRSQLAHLSRRNEFGLQILLGSGAVQAGSEIHYERTVESTSFPYPAAFRKMFRAQSQVQVQTQPHDEENRGGGDLRDVVQPPVMPDAVRLGEQVQERREWKWSITNRWLGVTGTSAIEFDTQNQPVYVVLGIFPRGYSIPRERAVFIHEPKQLFWELRWAAIRLRGLTSTLFSLRHVQGFKLYKCDIENGTHERINLDSNGVADLQLLLHTYKSWHVPNYITQAWANWIHQTLNNGSHDVLKGMYALELVLDWSVTRITIVVFLPVLLSLAIGLWLNASAWTDLATIQTAWGTASYVVTAGGLLAALLGILSSIAEN